MGKRKMHDVTYFQCDWTGLPMRQTNCYMPVWNDDGKLMKHGSYCCWEAVVADALDKNGANTEKVLKHINDVVGCEVGIAPHWQRLAWFERDTEADIASPQEFLAKCNETTAFTAVILHTDGRQDEVQCTDEDAAVSFTSQLNCEHTQRFQTVRKKNAKDKDLAVFYTPPHTVSHTLAYNTAASSAFKMQLYGDVVLVHQSKEACFLPRARYVDFTLKHYQEQFVVKKRKDAPGSLTGDDYASLKAQMASELGAVESSASSSATRPVDLAKASNLPPPTGQELADLMVASGVPRPVKKQRPSPLHQILPVVQAVAAAA